MISFIVGALIGAAMYFLFKNAQDTMKLKQNAYRNLLNVRLDRQKMYKRGFAEGAISSKCAQIKLGELDSHPNGFVTTFIHKNNWERE